MNLHLEPKLSLHTSGFVGRNNRPLSVGLASVIVAIAMLVPSQSVNAQTLNINVDTSLNMGVQLTTFDTETVTDRAPISARIDISFVFDDDPTIEWILGTITQVENPQALALNPTVRIAKESRDWRPYASLGVPWYVVPFRRFGVEIGGGVISPVDGGFAFVSGLTIQTLFAGADIPDDAAVFVFGLSAGGRFAF